MCEGGRIVKSLEEEVKSRLQGIAKNIKNELPAGMGFILLATPFYAEPNETEMMYVSNINRADVVKAMKEFIQKTENNFGNNTSKD